LNLSVRICLLICETGFRADGDKCVKITCRKGYEPNDEGTCEKIEVKKPIAKRDERRPSASGRSEMRPCQAAGVTTNRLRPRRVQAGQTRLSYRWSKVRHRRRSSRRTNGSVQLIQAVGLARSPRHYSARARLPGALPRAKSLISMVAFRLMNTLFNY
jgi:hypothetical protein